MIPVASLLAGVLLLSPIQMSESSAERERFLRNARVLDKEIIQEGITLPERVRLELDGVQRKAAFKARELVLPQSVRIGQETQEGLRDSWKFEVAAYELDKLLGLDLVPVAVVRKIEKHEGALIDWVEGVLPEFGASPAGFDSRAFENEVARAWLFDYLAYNIDRTSDNLLVVNGFKVKLIDHSRAFQRFLVPMRPLSRFPRAAIERLRGTRPEDFRRALRPYLTEDELEALLARRKRVLERVDELLASRPESEVFF
jgi:hypothetical protein